MMLTGLIVLQFNTDRVYEVCSNEKQPKKKTFRRTSLTNHSLIKQRLGRIGIHRPSLRSSRLLTLELSRDDDSSAEI